MREEGCSDFVLVDLAVEEEEKEEEKEEDNTQLRDDILRLLRLDDTADTCRVGLVCVLGEDRDCRERVERARMKAETDLAVVFGECSVPVSFEGVMDVVG